MTSPQPSRGHPLDPLPPVGRTFLAGFESTYLPSADVDVLELTGHDEHWATDLADVLGTGVRHLRYPLRWQHIERVPGVFDWAATDAVLGLLHDRGAVPVLDLVHHTSYPAWLTDGFRDARFGPAFVRYAVAVAERYPWIPAYTLFNEPFATLFLAGHQALWPPYDRGVAGFRRLLLSVLPAVSEVAQAYRTLLPAAHHVWVDTAEHHAGTGRGADYAALANDRRHAVLDIALGRDLDPARPFLGELLADDGARLLEVPPLRVDVLGLDYYCHSEWFFDDHRGHAPSPTPVGFAAVAEVYWERYGLPLLLSETNLRGLPSDRITWLRYMLEQYEATLDRGLPLHGFCWFPHVDSTDWDSLLARPAGRADPVGVLSLAPGGSREHTDFSRVWTDAARGLPVADIPAVRFQPPCDAQLAGVVATLSHWPWVDPKPTQAVHALVTDTWDHPTDRHRQEATMPATTARRARQSDLVVLSHLRWSWVWQRPQHLVSRLAAERAAAGARTWFVEEPLVGDVAEPVLRLEDAGDVTRVILVLPLALSPEARSEAHPLDRGFEDPAAARFYGELLADLLAEHTTAPDVWLYTPMALDVAQPLNPGRLIYDVMDDLASFKDAPDGLVLRQRRLLSDADIVFTGGPSLHRSVLRQRSRRVHLFRSGVETTHFAFSRGLRQPHERPVAGYVGVIDERLDLPLLTQLAELLPDWTLRIVGPVAKIDVASLPTAPNIEYPGMTAYEDLPRVMAGFDVALMPFALNEATRSISPTKTLEYLAAGLPVVSTRVPDVVDDYSDVVHLADDGAGFAAACRTVLDSDVRARDRRAAPLHARQEWDHIATAMTQLLDGTAVTSAEAGEPA